MKTIELNGETYLLLPCGIPTQPRVASSDYVIIRSRDSGCHAGYLKSQEGSTVVLVNSRRLWYWSGAATLSQLAVEGVKNPDECKFPQAIPEITIYNICEKISTTEAAQKSIESVPVWKR